MTGSAHPLWLVFVAFGLLACPAGSSPARVASGEWGGRSARLTVTDAGATLELDCAHGSIPRPLALDDKGAFDLAGSFVAEHGGPTRPGETEVQKPAHYKGTANGQTLTLTITLDEGGDPIGPFTLDLGQPARLTKCR